MKRRGFLTTIPMAIGTGLVSGCTTSNRRTGRKTRTNASGTGVTDTAVSGTQTTDPASTSRGGTQRRVSMAGVDEVPKAYNLRMEVEVLQATITDVHTARLRVTATDQSSEKRRLGVGTGECSLFNRAEGRSDPAGLWLRTPGGANSTPTEGHWTRKQNAFAAYGCGYQPAIHDEPITNEYVVWDDGAVGGYMTPGTYRFETTIAVGNRSRETTAATATDRLPDLRWGFSLSVENPHE